jgi:hypothetical protein
MYSCICFKDWFITLYTLNLKKAFPHFGIVFFFLLLL